MESSFLFFFHVCNLEAIGLPGILRKNYRKPAKVNSHVFPDGLNFLLLVWGSPARGSRPPLLCSLCAAATWGSSLLPQHCIYCHTSSLIQPVGKVRRSLAVECSLGDRWSRAAQERSVAFVAPLWPWGGGLWPALPRPEFSGLDFTLSAFQPPLEDSVLRLNLDSLLPEH